MADMAGEALRACHERYMGALEELCEARREVLRLQGELASATSERDEARREAARLREDCDRIAAAGIRRERRMLREVV